MPLTKFVIISHGRAGTTYLLKNFKRHPEVTAFTEPLHNTLANRTAINGHVWNSEESAMAFANANIFKNPELGTKAAGFKLFFYHCRNNEKASDIWRALLADRSYKIIFANRRNFLNRYLSEMRAQASGVWHPSSGNDWKQDYAEPFDLEIKVPHMMHQLARLYSSYNIVRRQFTEREVYEFFYEDLDATYDAVVKDIYRHLGVEPLSPQEVFVGGTLSRETTRIRTEAEVSDAIRNSYFSEYADTCPLLA